MIADVFYENQTEIVFSYLPAWEMFFSMHVLANPEHHGARLRWAKRVEEDFPLLTREIRELEEATGSWTLIIDAAGWDEIRQMEIGELLAFFRTMNIYQWNSWVRRPAEREMTIGEKDRILRTVNRYYESVFCREELILRPYLLRVLRDEREDLKRQGLWNWCEKIHTRLRVEEDALLYLKNREYRFEKRNIRTVFVTASTFVSPHLWLYQNAGRLEVVKGILTEQADREVPADLVRMLRALGERTRLQIIRNLLRGVCTTGDLALKIGISQAAVSKHMRILSEAGLVKKTRKGAYTVYTFRKEAIEYLPCAFYETML